MIDEAILLQRQEALQAEASAVLCDLNLLDLLQQAGEPLVVGSYVLGLMAWRDIDIHVYCNPINADLSFEAVRPLASHPRITKLRYANWSGPLAIKELPDGYYWGVRYRSDEGAEWKIDLWFVAAHAPHPEQIYMAQIKEQLTLDTQLAILWIKEVWHKLPSYRDTVFSLDIYDAVLQHGVRTPEDFALYLGERAKPTS